MTHEPPTVLHKKKKATGCAIVEYKGPDFPFSQFAKEVKKMVDWMIFSSCTDSSYYEDMTLYALLVKGK